MPFIGTLQAGLPFNHPPTIGDQRAPLGRRIGVHRTMPSVIPQNARRCRPTQLSSCKKRILVIAITSRAQWPS
jgi:hypothetical protein